MKEFWNKVKQLAKDVWEYLRGLKSAIYFVAVAAIGAAEQVGVEKFVPEKHVGLALVGVAFGGIIFRAVSTGPMKGFK